MAGRTPVPEKESIESFAAHQATMVVFLSTGMLRELSDRLIAGGYKADTPAAIVYKATWEDEKTFLCTVGTLAETAEKNHVTKTALMIIGDVVAHHGYQRSKLYDRSCPRGRFGAPQERFYLIIYTFCPQPDGMRNFIFCLNLFCINTADRLKHRPLYLTFCLSYFLMLLLYFFCWLLI